MAIHRGTRHIGGIGTSSLHVPSGLILGALAVATAVAATYVATTLSNLQPPATTETMGVPDLALTGVTSAASRHVDVNLAEVDSHEFILQQAGVTPASEAMAMLAKSAPSPASAQRASSFEETSPAPGQVDVGLAEVDTQAYILAEAGPALQHDLRPSAH